MQTDAQIYVIGCTSSFYKDENGYRVKTEGVRQYLEYLNEEFENIKFFSELTQSEISGGDLLSIDSDDLHSQTVSGPMSFASDLIRNSYTILSDETSGEITTILYLPSMFSFFISIVLLYKSDNIILYYMSDTNKVIWGDSSQISKIKNLIYNKMDNILLNHCDYVIYRDKSVADRSDHDDLPFVRSKPLIAIDDQDIFVRNSTCESNPIQLLFVGSLIPRKGVKYLLRSLSELNSNLDKPMYKLVIVGDGHEKDILVERAEDLDISDAVEFKGHVADNEMLKSIYRESDIFVLPSLEEGFPRVVVEAMSQSLPVITTKVGEIPDRLDEDEALLISPESTIEITEAVNKIVTNDDVRKSLILNSRQKAKDILTCSAGEQHASIIRSIANKD